MPDEKQREPTELERYWEFRFPDAVSVPPCGQVFPEGVELRLHLNPEEGSLLAVYAGEANGHSVAYGVCQVYYHDSAIDYELELFPAFESDIKTCAVELKGAGLFDDCQSEALDRHIPGTRPTTKVETDKPHNLAFLINQELVDLCVLHCGARQIELTNRELGLVRTSLPRAKDLTR